MFRVIVALILVTTMVLVAGRVTCPRGLEWTNCGSPCPPTCANRSPVCGFYCVKGCKCKPGSILKSKSKYNCVNPRWC